MDANTEEGHRPSSTALKARIRVCDERIAAGDALTEFLEYSRDDFTAQMYALPALRSLGQAFRARSSCGGRRRPGRRAARRTSSSTSGSDSEGEHAPALSRYFLAGLAVSS